MSSWFHPSAICFGHFSLILAHLRRFAAYDDDISHPRTSSYRTFLSLIFSAKKELQSKISAWDSHFTYHYNCDDTLPCVFISKFPSLETCSILSQAGLITTPISIAVILDFIQQHINDSVALHHIFVAKFLSFKEWRSWPPLVVLWWRSETQLINIKNSFQITTGDFPS